MNKLYLVLALLFALSACSVGKKCTYTQDGTKISSYVWFYNGGKPIDLDKNNCNQDENRTRTKCTDANEDRDLFDHHGRTRDIWIFSNPGEAQPKLN